MYDISLAPEQEAPSATQLPPQLCRRAQAAAGPSPPQQSSSHNGAAATSSRCGPAQTTPPQTVPAPASSRPLRCLGVRKVEALLQGRLSPIPPEQLGWLSGRLCECRPHHGCCSGASACAEWKRCSRRAFQSALPSALDGEPLVIPPLLGLAMESGLDAYPAAVAPASAPGAARIAVGRYGWNADDLQNRTK